MTNAYDQARLAIDSAHASDPKRAENGQAAERVYADRMEGFITSLNPAAPMILRLAARCQHLQRWSVPRASFPLDKIGYHAWRKSLYIKQASQARELLLSAGVVASEADAVYDWVSKTGLKVNTGTQALEDAACLVFFAHEIPGFATLHPDYTRDKYVDIISKTWRKMSPAAREAALALALPAELAALVKEAVSGAA